MALKGKRAYNFCLLLLLFFLIAIPLLRLSLKSSGTEIKADNIAPGIRLRSSDELRSSPLFTHKNNFKKLVPNTHEILSSIITQINQIDNERIGHWKKTLLNDEIKDIDSLCLIVMKKLLFLSDSTYYTDKREFEKTVAWFRPSLKNKPFDFGKDTLYSLKLEVIDTSDIEMSKLHKVTNVERFLLGSIEE